MKIYWIKYLLLFVLSSLFNINASAQFESVKHPTNSNIRNQINQQRVGIDFSDKEAYSKAQKFIQMDSTYYMGYMYEGIYKSEKAADVFGYQNAIKPLEKALSLIANDYDQLLRKRSSDYYQYYSYYWLHQDYSIIAYYLENAYAYSNQIEKAYQIIQNVLQYNFQKHYALIPYTTLAWLVHRNRFYDNATYSFLKNTIAENEKLAHAYLDSANLEIDKNITINSSIFQPKFYENLYLNVDFYRSILYSYNLEMDSANFYYERLYNKGYVSYNNYATFNAIQGKFETATINYQIASFQGNDDYQLKEFIYFGSILNLFKNEISDAAYDLEETIKDQGSTPGFGWYNLGLARVHMYNGSYEMAQKHINKAREFNELHIGTTLGAVHYEFTTQLLQLKLYTDLIQLEKFQNANWWYRPKSLWKLMKLYYNKHVCEQAVMELLMNNKERDMVIYSLFSTESTVTWDEIWYLLKDYGHKYFIEKYKELANSDQRPKIVKYHKLMLAKIYFEAGEIINAKKNISEIISDYSNNADEDGNFEKLYWGRVYELLGLIAEKEDDQKLYQLACNKVMINYPQLFITTKLKPSIDIQIIGENTSALKRSLKKYNINKPSSKFPYYTCIINEAMENGEVKYLVSLKNESGEPIKKDIVINASDELINQKIIDYIFSLNTISEKDLNNNLFDQEDSSTGPI